MTRIIVIDNEREFTSLIRSFLEASCNCKVDVIPDGYNGIRMAAKLKPDLILLDVLMPAMNGFLILKRLKENEETSSIHVAMITAVDDEESKKKAADLGCVDYFVKPIKLEDLKHRVNQLLSGH